MDKEFWHARWQHNEIGFHQAETNRYLIAHEPRLGLAVGDRVFVPLCGKSQDMLWLARKGYSVVGVELSETAVEAFFEENGLAAQRHIEDGFDVYRAGQIELIRGDFFDVTAGQLGDVKGVFDRAALVALPPEMRGRYARRLIELLPANAAMLLVTFEYPQAQMPGPPFSVDRDELDRLYGRDFDIEQLQSEDVLAAQPSFRDKGLTRLREHVYLLRKSVRQAGDKAAC